MRKEVTTCGGDWCHLTWPQLQPELPEFSYNSEFRKPQCDYSYIQETAVVGRREKTMAMISWCVSLGPAWIFSSLASDKYPFVPFFLPAQLHWSSCSLFFFFPKGEQSIRTEPAQVTKAGEEALVENSLLKYEQQQQQKTRHSKRWKKPGFTESSLATR